MLGRIRALCFCKRRNEKKVLNKQLFLPTGQRVVGWGNSGEFPLRNILGIEHEIPVEISVKIVETFDKMLVLGLQTSPPA